MKTKSFSAMWSDKLCRAITEATTEPYPIECHDGCDDFKSLMAAVNQGIDSHLQAVHFSEFAGDYGKRGFMIEPESLPVLVRRLMDGDDNSQGLASSICSTLDIELI